MGSRHISGHVTAQHPQAVCPLVPEKELKLGNVMNYNFQMDQCSSDDPPAAPNKSVTRIANAMRATMRQIDAECDGWLVFLCSCNRFYAIVTCKAGHR